MKTIVIFCALVTGAMAHCYGKHRIQNQPSYAAPMAQGQKPVGGGQQNSGSQSYGTSSAPSNSYGNYGMQVNTPSYNTPMTTAQEQKPAYGGQQHSGSGSSGSSSSSESSSSGSSSSGSSSSSMTVGPTTKFNQEIRGSEKNHYSFQSGDGLNMNENTDVTFTPSQSSSSYGGWGSSSNDYSGTAVLRKSGSYSYTAPDGTPIFMSWTADKDGFSPVGTHIPTAPPMPAEHAAAHAKAKANAASYGTTNTNYGWNSGYSHSQPCHHHQSSYTVPVETVMTSYTVTHDVPKVETPTTTTTTTTPKPSYGGWGWSQQNQYY